MKRLFYFMLVTLVFGIQLSALAEEIPPKAIIVDEDQARIDQMERELNQLKAKKKFKEYKERASKIYEKAKDKVSDGLSAAGEGIKKVSEPVVKPFVEAYKKEVKESAEREDPQNYDPDTCEWFGEIPRRVIKSPSCGRTPMNICVGYVVCNQKDTDGGKFVRMTTCSSDLCGSGDAKECTKDPNYSSIKAPDEKSNTVSRKILKTINSGSSAQ